MANIKISQLTPKGANLGASDLLEISEFNGSGYTTKSITGQEIIDAIPAGAAVNPTSTYIPYNDGGVFANSSLRVYPDTIYGTGIPFGIYNIGNPVYGGSLNLNIDDVNAEYSIGQANIFGSPSALSGIAINGNYGEAIIGVGMSSPSNGVFRASAASGNVWLGTYGESYGVGFHGYSGTMFLGSSLVTPASPSNPTTPVAWYNITNEFGVQFFAPLYQ